MGTTADKLNAILNTKEAIKQAIRDKGVYIGDHDAFAEYPDAIRSIETGSSEGGSDEFFNLRTDNGTNMCALFCYYPGNELDLSVLDTSKAINMSMMFSYCFSISSLDLSSFDTRNVCNMSQMFSYSNFNNINLSNFDTGNVYDMNNMFAGCNGLTSLDLSHFNTSNVNDMNGMFNNCSSLSSLDLSGFNTSNVTNMNYMFAYCFGLKSLDLSHFNTSNVTNIDYMFSWCTNLEELDIRNFNVNNIEYVNCMFEGCNVLHKLRLDNCGYDTINKIINSGGFPTGQVYVYESGEYINRKMYVQEANVAGLTAPNGWEFVFVDSDDNEIVPEPEEPEIPEIPLYEVGMFSNAENKTELTEVNVMVNSSHTDLSNMFNGCYNLQTINNIEQWDTSNVMYMNHMFDQCHNLISLDLSSFNTSNVYNMGYMFFDCNNLKTLDISNFDMSKVEENTDFMFSGCDNLRVLRLDNCDRNTIERIINNCNLPTGDKDGISRLMYVQEANIINPDNQDERLTAPDGWRFVYVAGNPQDTYDSDSKPFRGDRDIQEVNVAVTKQHDNLSEMFRDCENLEVIHNIDTWDTGNVTSMSEMFSNCRKLIELDLSSWYTGYVTNMNNMFDSCEHLIYLDIRNFNISDYTEIRDMFIGCNKLQVLRLDNWTHNTIERIINDTNLPTGDIDGRLRKMYILEKYVTNPEGSGLTAPDGWEFVYELGDKKEE